MQLKPFQSQAVELLTHQSNTHLVCNFPTGAGKTLIFIEYLRKNPTINAILVSPLVALSEQLRVQLETNGISCAMFSDCEQNKKKPRVWILSPESINRYVETKSKEHRPSFLIADECHSLWEWGQSFRPDFKNIKMLTDRLDIKKSLWLSATISDSVLDEIKKVLSKESVKVLGGFSFPKTLSWQVREVLLAEKMSRLMWYLKTQDQSGLVFVNTRSAAQKMSDGLKKMGIAAGAFHAGFSKEEKKNLGALLSQGSLRVLIATSAFGMGMDIKSVGWVLVYQPPVSIMAMAQAFGRTGRNGSKGFAEMIWDPWDFRFMDWLINQNDQNKKEVTLLRKFVSSSRTTQESILQRYFGASTENQKLELH